MNEDAEGFLFFFAPAAMNCYNFSGLFINGLPVPGAKLKLCASLGKAEALRYGLAHHTNMRENKEKKHPCDDCNNCQFCSDERCSLCLCSKHKTRQLSVEEQIALYDALNKDSLGK